MDERRLAPHDRNQLELKLAYVLESGQRRQRYKVETFLFLPRSLGLNAHNYSAAQFFAETAAFIRLKTPTVALSALARPGQAEPYFTSVRDRVQGILAGEVQPDGTTLRRLKVLGAIFRRAVRDEALLLVAEVDRATKLPAGDVATQAARAGELAARLGGFLQDVEGALGRLRELGKICEHAVVPTSIRDVWRAVDELVALVAEEQLTALTDAVDSALAGTVAADGEAAGTLAARRKALAMGAVAASRYRLQRGYPSLVRDGDDNEGFPYRSRILKRVASSALYLDSSHEDAGRLASDVVGMVAAALAMLFAVAVGLWAQKTWSVFSGAFVAVMVVSYMVKDRIKEWGKRYLGSRLRRFASDQVVRVRDAHTGRQVGVCRETFRMTVPARAPADILALRHQDHPATIAEQGRPEVVLCYAKDVHLMSRALHQQLPGIEGLTDVIRFNFGPLRQRMDDPDEPFRHVRPDTLQVVTTPCRRVYHLNLVLRFTSMAGARPETHTDRVRIVMDQHGIRRAVAVGSVGGDGPLDALGGLGE